MAQRKNSTKARMVGEIGAAVRSQAPAKERETAGAFAQLLVAGIPAADLATHASADLIGAALGFWRFARDRRPGEAKIRAFNPQPKSHGWTLSHTVVEIVTDNSPFLVASLTAALNRLDLTVHLVLHPLARVVRKKGRLQTILPEPRRRGAPRGRPDPDAAATRTEPTIMESAIQFHVDQRTGREALGRIEREMARVLDDVALAVGDWAPMKDKLARTIEEIDRIPVAGQGQEINEARSFIAWIADDNFTLLGIRDYRFHRRGANTRLAAQPGALGLLRDAALPVFEKWLDRRLLPPEAEAYLHRPNIVAVTKSQRKSTVHRTVYFDVIGIKIFDLRGRVVGERFILGLFTSAAYSLSPVNIPMLQQKLRRVEALAGFERAGHNFKAFAHILQTYPRDELFQADAATLKTNVMGILGLQERQRIAVLTRHDVQRRFVSCLVFIPRERFQTSLRIALAGELERTFGGKLIDFTAEFGAQSVLVRVLFIIETATDGARKRVDIERLTARLTELSRGWEDRLRDALVARHGEERGLARLARFAEAFGSGYRDDYGAEDTVDDIDGIEAVLAGADLVPRLYRRPGDPARLLRLKLYRPGHAVPLSDVLPMLENMGLKVIGEIPNEVKLGPSDGSVWIHDFTARQNGPAAAGTIAAPRISSGGLRDNFHDAFIRIFTGEMENDGFNQLVLQAGLAWRQIVFLRAVAKYLRQTRIAYSQAYMELSLAANPTVAASIVALFETRFDPEWRPGGRRRRTRDTDKAARVRRARAARAVETRIAAALDKVVSLDEDRILRRFANLVAAVTRTNYFQRDPQRAVRPTLSFKIDCQIADGLPAPRPWVEIFVYSPEMEGLHLRGGPVARGGIRWSDRPEDFRTEVLGLMKAQMVKNAVIVPTGAKGGFVVKKLGPSGSGAMPAEARGVACYRLLIAALLDITDNRVDGKPVTPPRTVAYDGADTYLVVAADKGTAGFSDIANEISQAHDYWLGDAFASGGSAGYDHKKMGITARGAWESVKLHFRELGHDIQARDFTCVGVGGMSGDVFGNAMLLSRHTILIAAFDHRYIFVDPKPDAATSHAERRRLFRHAHASWDQYDRTLISPGGGVFDRLAKSVTVTPAMARLFGLTKKRVTPAELIAAMLCAPVDLIWFGGIGTYVKASGESHGQVDDRANDALRVDGAKIRARVIGEGANLAVTQLGRIEFARAGGHINADFIDNSGGVDCSDREVNIKIALNAAVAAGRLTGPARDKLLASMTADVASLVLSDNSLQAQAISQAMHLAAQKLDAHWNLLRSLERAGRLERNIENLPDDEELAERRDRAVGLSRPEYALLFAHAKKELKLALLASDAPDDPHLAGDLTRYFPGRMGQRYAREIAGHRLRREIIATYVANSLVNRVDASFVDEIERRTGAGPADIAQAYVAARDIFGLRELWRAIESLNGRVATRHQSSMRHSLERLVRRATRWFLNHTTRPVEISALIENFGPGIGDLIQALPQLIAPASVQAVEAKTASLRRAGVPGKLGSRIALLEAAPGACDIVFAARQAKLPIRAIGRLYFDVGDRLGIDWLRQAAGAAAASSPWEGMAINAIVDDSYLTQCALAIEIAVRDRGKYEGWAGRREAEIARIEDLMEDLRAAPQTDLAMLTVANRRLGSLVSD